jgi:hypothetical protein
MQGTRTRIFMLALIDKVTDGLRQFGTLDFRAILG